MSTRSTRIDLLPLCLAAVAMMAGLSGFFRGPLSFLVFFVVVFGALLCLRAVVRTRARRTETSGHG